MTDYSNSDKSKEREPTKVVEKLVLSGEVIQKKPGIGKKFKTIFLGGDAKSAANYVLADVVLPAIRDLMFDALRGGAERVIYGESRRARNRPIEARSRIQYSAFSHMRDPREARAALSSEQPHTSMRYRTERADSRDLILSERSDAETLVERLIDIIDTYDVASVMDLNEILGLPSTPIDNKWGWTSLGKVEIRQVREGYLVDLPPPEEI